MEVKQKKANIKNDYNLNKFLGNSCPIFSSKSIETTIMAVSYKTHDVVSTA
jgi:hypothetical protein